MWSNCGMLEGIEPVEIFHQFIFLAVSQLDNITWSKMKIACGRMVSRAMKIGDGTFANAL